MPVLLLAVCALAAPRTPFRALAARPAAWPAAPAGFPAPAEPADRRIILARWPSAG